MQEQDTIQEVHFVFPEKTERVEYKHVFDDKELIQLGAELNTQRKDKNQMELDKKSAMSTWKSRIEAKEAEMNITGNYLNDGYKFEPVDAIKKVNGNTLEWEFFHPENGELIDTRKMSQKEIREVFPKREDLKNKTIEYYNPFTNVVVDNRIMSTEEVQLAHSRNQLTIDKEAEAIALEKDTLDNVGTPFDEDLYNDTDFEGGELPPPRRRKPKK